MLYQLVLLVFFNEPFSILKSTLIPGALYVLVFQTLVQATFFSLLLFFWLVLIHSLSENEHVNIDERRFYIPKKILCGGLWAALSLFMDYVNTQTGGNPSFLWSDDIHASYYQVLEAVTIGILILYSSYFALIAYISFFHSATLRDMKHSYKVTMIMTIAVIASCTILMLWQASTSVVDYNQRSTLYVALLALLNIYLYVTAYIYSPAMDSLEDIQLKHARKEHEHIMNQFYEQELPDITNRTLETHQDAHTSVVVSAGAVAELVKQGNG